MPEDKEHLFDKDEYQRQIKKEMAKLNSQQFAVAGPGSLGPEITSVGLKTNIEPISQKFLDVGFAVQDYGTIGFVSQNIDFDLLGAKYNIFDLNGDVTFGFLNFPLNRAEIFTVDISISTGTPPVIIWPSSVKNLPINLPTASGSRYILHMAGYRNDNEEVYHVIGGSTGSILPAGTVENDHLEWDNTAKVWLAQSFLEFGGLPADAVNIPTLRFSNDQSIAWRNNANTANLRLLVDSSDTFFFTNATDTLASMVDGNFQFNGALGVSLLQLVNRDAGIIDLEQVGEIRFVADDATAGGFQATTYGRILVNADDVAPTATLDGRMTFFVMRDGSSEQFMAFNTTGNNNIDINKRIDMNNNEIDKTAGIFPASDGLDDIGTSSGFSYNSVFMDAIHFIHSQVQVATRRMISFEGGGDMEYNVPTGDQHVFRINAVDEYIMGNLFFQFKNLNQLQFLDAGDAQDIKVSYIDPVFIMDLTGTASTIRMTFAATAEYEFNATQIDMKGNTLNMAVGTITNTNDITPDVSDTYDLGAAGNRYAQLHVTTIQGAGQTLTLNASLAAFNIDAGDEFQVQVGSGSVELQVQTDTVIFNAEVIADSTMRFAETTAPSAVANTAFIYSKDVATVTKMFILESDGNEVQIGAATSVTTMKTSVRIATEVNDTLSGLAARDGVTPVAGDRVLVKAQTTASANGIYTATAGAWTRATDFDTDAEATSGSLMLIQEGTVNDNKAFQLTTNEPITLGTTSLTFAEFGAGGGGNEFSDALFRIFDNVDSSRKLAFQTGGIAATTTRTWTVQNADGTVALLDGGVTQIFIDDIEVQGTGRVILNNVGSIELFRTAGPFIDFKDLVTDDFDCRIIQSSNGLLFQTGGQGATASALLLDSNQDADFQNNNILAVTNVELRAGFDVSKLFFDGGGDTYFTGSGTSGRINIVNDGVNTYAFGTDGFRMINDTFLQMDERTTAPAAAGNAVRLFAKEDGVGGITKLGYMQDNGTEVFPIGVGGTTFADNVFAIFDDITTTKRLTFSLAGGTGTNTFAVEGTSDLYVFPNGGGNVIMSQGNQTIGGLKTFSATTFFDSNVDLGDSTAETVTFTARVDSDLLPNVDNTRDLGSQALSRRWNEVWCNLVGFDVNHFILFDATQVQMRVTGTGDNWNIHDGSSKRLFWDYSTDDFYPVDSVSNLGRAANRWIEIFSDNVLNVSFTKFKQNMIVLPDVDCMAVCAALPTIEYEFKPERYQKNRADKKDHEIRRLVGYNGDALQSLLPNAVKDDMIYTNAIIGTLLVSVRHLESRIKELENLVVVP